LLDSLHLENLACWNMTATFSEEDHEILKAIVTGDPELSDLIIHRNVTSKAKQTELWCRLVGNFYETTSKMYTKEQIYNFIQRKRRAGVKQKISSVDEPMDQYENDIWTLNPKKSHKKRLDNMESYRYEETDCEVQEYDYANFKQEYQLKTKHSKGRSRPLSSISGGIEDELEDSEIQSKIAQKKQKTEIKILENVELEAKLVRNRLQLAQEENEKAKEELEMAKEERERKKAEGVKRIELLDLLKNKLEEGSIDPMQAMAKFMS